MWVTVVNLGISCLSQSGHCLHICTLMKDFTTTTIGVLGGGQLGRMMIQSAIDYNLDIRVMDPDPQAPCKRLVDDFVMGDITNYEAVMAFGEKCDLMTIEIENVNTQALKDLAAAGKKVYPQPAVIELIKDKRKQKTFYKANGIATADFILTETKEDVAQHQSMLPAVHKLGTEGYDGRGVQIIRTVEDLDLAFDRPGLLEPLVNIEKELSVIVAKNPDGEIRSFPAVELSYHPEKNLVEFLFCPADISSEVEARAEALARDVIDKLDMIGLLAVEMFLTKDDELLVNEIAPRTHNSGHQSIEGNITSQFEQHLRSILNLPLGDTSITRPTAMVNLLGEDGFTGPAKYEGIEKIAAMKDVHVHLYGKALTKPFRKMGHVTLGDEDVQQLKERAREVKNVLKVIA